MRSLEQALQDHELIVLRVIGEWWEQDLTGADKKTAITVLSGALSQLDLAQELVYLPKEEAEALKALAAEGGRIPVGTFTRKFGEVRQMGPGRLEREEPWFEPVSSAESLWYRGLIYLAFDDDMVEYFYLPNELLAQLPKAEAEPAAISAETPEPPLTSSVQHPEKIHPAEISAVDDLTTLLALALTADLRTAAGGAFNTMLLNPDRERNAMLLTLAEEIGLVRTKGNAIRPTRSAVDWLKESRDGQLYALAEAWVESAWNDLRHTPGLRCEGEGWSNDPKLARGALLEMLPRDTDWYRVGDLIASIKAESPDFQRPDGNYDTWYIRDEAQNVYLNGFESWELVEGRLLRFLLTGPMAWLGLVDSAEADDMLVYRLTPRAVVWLNGDPPSQDEVAVPLVVQPDGTLLVPHNADRHRRFQTARIAKMDPVTPNKPFVYRLTPDSLTQAKAQGISAERVLTFLSDASGRPVPKSVQRAVARWSEKGVEGKLESAVILRVSDAAILDTLRNNPKTRDFIGESLGEFAAMVKRGEWEQFRAATAELGLLLDME